MEENVMDLLPSERMLRAILAAWAIAFAALFVLCISNVMSRADGSPASHFYISLAGVIVLPLLITMCVRATSGIRSKTSHVRFIKFTMFIIFVAALVLQLVLSPAAKPLLLSISLGAFAVFLVTMLFFNAAVKSRFGLRYFSPEQALTFRALANAFVAGGKMAVLTPDELVKNVDYYLSAFQSPRKWQTKLMLIAIEYLPLVYFHPPMSYMGLEERINFISRRLTISTGTIRNIVRGAYQMSYLSYYGDTRTYTVTGFVPFEEREKFRRMPKKPDPPNLKVIVTGKTIHEIDTNI